MHRGIGFKVALGIGYCQHDPACLFRQHFIGHAGIGVLLVNDSGNTQLHGFPDHGAADIAAGSHTDIRLEIPDNLFGF